VRPWQHVLEPLSGYLRAIESMLEQHRASPDAWNFAPEAASHVTVGGLAEALCEAWGGDIAPLVQGDPASLHEAHLLALDATKARIELGWEPRWDFLETIQRTTDWYKAFGEQADMQAFSLAQIQDYTHSPLQRREPSHDATLQRASAA
jgi:CDP-glucose 4,6-dehydratase